MSESGDDHNTANSDGEQRAVPLHWSRAEDIPIVFVNQFALQALTADEFVLVLGQVTPPLLLEPTPAQLAAIESVEVRPVYRLGMTSQRLQDLFGILQRRLHPKQVGQDAEEENEA